MTTPFDRPETLCETCETPIPADVALRRVDRSPCVNVPDPEEAWALIWLELSTNWRLRREEAEDLLPAFFVAWCEEWAELMVHNHVINWEPWLRQRVRWRTMDYVRQQGRHRLLRRKAGAVSRPRRDGRDDSTEERTWNHREGAVQDDSFDDPVEAQEWDRDHNLAWEELEDREAAVLLAWAGLAMGRYPDKVAAAAALTAELGLTTPITKEAFESRATRAKQRFLKLKAEHDPTCQNELDKILAELTGKRVVKACRGIGKAHVPFYLDPLERVVFAVAIEVALKWLDREEFLDEASRRAGVALGAARFEHLLNSARVKIDGAGGGRFFSDRMVMEYVADRWDAVNKPGGSGTVDGDGDDEQ